jgi:hypothetical protein
VPWQSRSAHSRWCVTGAAQAGDKKTAKELFEKARQAAAYVGSDSDDYTFAEVRHPYGARASRLYLSDSDSVVYPPNTQALVSIAIYAHTEGEMEDREIHQIISTAMRICRRIPAINRQVLSFVSLLFGASWHGGLYLYLTRLFSVVQ